VLVLLTLVLSRAAWMYPAVAVARALQRRADAEVLHGWRETTVVTWAGMRGVVTVATALALPQLVASGAAFPRRAEIVLVALVCVLVTLVVQGLTLSPLVRWLGVGTEADDGAAVAELRARAAAAVLEDLRAPGDAAVPDDVRRAVVLQYESYARAQQALSDARTGAAGEAAPEQLERLLERASEVERGVVLHARRTGEVSSATADEVLRDIEARAVRDLGQAD
jgi:CPA1 family monovalent cation:H+ antiporter